MSTTYRLAQRWGVGVGIAAGAAAVATIMSTMSGAPVARADGDSYSELLDNAQTTLFDAARQFASSPDIPYATPAEVEEEFFKPLQLLQEDMLQQFIGVQESVQGNLPALEQTSPGVLGADQAALTTATDLSNADHAYDADPSSLTTQLDLVAIDLTQVYPVEVDEFFSTFAAPFAGLFGVPLP